MIDMYSEVEKIHVLKKTFRRWLVKAGRISDDGDGLFTLDGTRLACSSNLIQFSPFYEHWTCVDPVLKLSEFAHMCSPAQVALQVYSIVTAGGRLVISRQTPEKRAPPLFLLRLTHRLDDGRYWIFPTEKFS